MFLKSKPLKDVTVEVTSGCHKLWERYLNPRSNRRGRWGDSDDGTRSLFFTETGVITKELGVGEDPRRPSVIKFICTENNKSPCVSTSAKMETSSLPESPRGTKRRQVSFRYVSRFLSPTIEWVLEEFVSYELTFPPRRSV